MRSSVALKVFSIMAWLCCVCGTTFAHDVPPSIAMLDIGLTTIDIELQLPLSELGSALALPLAADPREAVNRYGSVIRDYVRERVRLSDGAGRLYTVDSASLSLLLTHNANWISNDWVVVHLHFTAPPSSSTAAFRLDDTAIVQRVLSHSILVYVRRDLRNKLLGDEPRLVGVIGYGKTYSRIDGSAGSWWRGFGHLFSMGMRHIAEGSDHLLFLLTLLLPAPLLAMGGRWTVGKSRRQGFRTILMVVSGFTIGHSVTLALAASGWFVVPTRSIEVLIAVSILVSSIHATRPIFQGREVWVASGFGLIHGLAFAETLAGLNFDGFSLALSLCAFNLGIEAMQLLVIGATLPLMMALSTGRCYGVFRILGVSVASYCAVGWIMERAFQLANPAKPLTVWLASPPDWLVLAVCLAGGGAFIWLLSSRSTPPERANSRTISSAAPCSTSDGCRPKTSSMCN